MNEELELIRCLVAAKLFETVELNWKRGEFTDLSKLKVDNELLDSWLMIAAKDFVNRDLMMYQANDEYMVGLTPDASEKYNPTRVRLIAATTYPKAVHSLIKKGII